jgi:hypothetical protein
MDEWVIDVARRLHSLVPFERLDPWSLPMTRGELASEVRSVRRRAHSFGADEATVAGLLAELEEELAAEIGAIDRGDSGRGAATGRATLLAEVRDRERGALRPIARGELAVRLSRLLSWHQRAEVDAHGGDDPDFLGREWKRGITGDFTHAYAALRLPGIRLAAGRRPIGWGTGSEGTLILQGGAPPLDQIGLDATRGSFSAHAFVASLDDYDVSGSEAPARRWLSGHRLSVRLRDRARVSLSETVVYGGVGRGVDWAYANPLVVYYAVDWNRSGDDNVLWSADAYLRAHPTLDLYGEFLADDFQYDRETEPNQIAFLVGMRAKNLPRLPGVFFDAEYTRVNNWVYGHEVEWNRYTHEEAALGHPLGPDADRVLLRLLIRRGRSLELLALHEHRREGPGSIDDPRDAAVPHGTGFLTGEVVTRDLPALEIRFHPRAGRRFHARIERSDQGDWTLSAGAFFRIAGTRKIHG